MDVELLYARTGKLIKLSNVRLIQDEHSGVDPYTLRSFYSVGGILWSPLKEECRDMCITHIGPNDTVKIGV